ncbi:Cof-type HAD-IIB family hydrolase [Wielerella bovis]|uniref:Cof-type HAD-IIB family hydrolase n=1 Tax=Wielerella bovis TaxID=2917790 RepID=UPI00201859FF|nr:Cof-type HAD-IIB family hydrolase [Wielerella bovis]MCG7657956.1 Cof-type HAD-IIB family hydrolase [Wielerella bovis]MCG7660178.1 Cof-type HAD-IIB family hydrolase [Wielerella bovis]
MKQPKPKIVFFDIDETLYINHGEQRVPESAKIALRALKQQGIITAIATGRTIAVLPEKILAVIEECGIDMIVSINGQYVAYRGEKLAAFPVDKQKVAELTGSLKAHQIAHAFVAREGLFTVLEDEHSAAALAALQLPYAHDPAAHERYDIYQMLVFYTEAQNDAVRPLLPQDDQIIRWHPHAIDLLQASGSKARGIEAALGKLGLQMSDAMAFGDGPNDMEMLQEVGFGVAMGNAVPELKVVADYVCPAIDDDGIYRGLVDLGVIDAGTV